MCQPQAGMDWPTRTRQDPWRGTRPWDAVREARVRFGCVTSETGRIGLLSEIGYDYVELRCRALAPLDDDFVFAAIRDRIAEAPIRPEVLSGLIPPFVALKVAGPDVDRAALRRYLGTMLSRASQVGAATVVLGAGAARTVPAGFPRDRALGQLREWVAIAADLAAPREITIALEPLNRGETNLVNNVDEAVGLVRSLGRPNLRVAVGYFQLLADGVPLSQVRLAGSLIGHAHTSDADRRPPGSSPSDQPPFLEALRAAGYDGRLSVECRFADFGIEAPAALTYLRDAWARLGVG